MLFWCKKNEAEKQDQNLEEEHSKLLREHEELQSKYKSLEQHLANINSDLRKAKPMIDFDNMRVFSIERMVHNNVPTTILGYFLAEPVLSSDGEMIVMKDIVKEWYLYCNNERHEELVAEFQKWKGKQK